MEESASRARSLTNRAGSACDAEKIVRVAAEPGDLIRVRMIELNDLTVDCVASDRLPGGYRLKDTGSEAPVCFFIRTIIGV